MSVTIPEDPEPIIFASAIADPTLFAKTGPIGHMFHNGDLGLAYDHLAKRYADGTPVGDVSVVVSELKVAGLYDSLGGAAGLGHLVTHMVTAAAAEYHVQELSERFDASMGEGHPGSYPLTTIGSKSLQTLVGKLQRGEGDILYDAGEVFADFECGPGLLTFLAAGPGSGKTALAMQYGFQVLQHHPEIRLTVANAETGFDRLLKRELTRLSGVPARALRFADLTPAQLDAVEQAAAELEPLLTRVDVFEPPCTLKRIEQLQAVTPGLLILDYLQKFSPPNLDARNGATAVAAELRNLCHKGWAVLALSATARTTGKGGSNHDSSRLTLASLKESGEIEFNADAVYLIRDEGETDRPHVHDVELDCVKNRNGSMGGRRLVFEKPNLKFSLPAGSSLAAGEFADWAGEGSDLEAVF